MTASTAFGTRTAIGSNLGNEQAVPEATRLKMPFWETALDHYTLFGIDDLEQGSTYSAPQFVARFGGFSSLLGRYGGPAVLRSDLEEVKRHLYVPMMN